MSTPEKRSASPSPVPSPTSSPTSLRRRELAGLAAAAAAAPVIALVPATGDASPTPIRRRRLRLQRDPGSVVSALDVPLRAEDGAARRAAGGALRTQVMETTGFSMLGVTWRSGSGAVRARTRSAEGWSRWRELPALSDGPDPDSEEGRRTPPATEPVWVGPSTAVQLEVDSSIRLPVLTLIDPGVATSDLEADLPGRSPRRRNGGRVGRDGDATDATDDTATDADAEETAAAEERSLRPRMFGRRRWNPDPKLLNGKPGNIVSVRQVHVHHTVSTNSYSRKDVPGMIRGMYRYHTNSLGWADIGYNFLVDKYGRIWVGRRGSANLKKKIRGAHTLGFNDYSVGVSVIGNYEAAKPNRKIIGGISRIAAWQLEHYGRDPLGTIRVRSTGSDKYPAGTRPRLPVIDGHRDTNDTACPGRYLYRRLPRIRRRTAHRIERFT